VPEEVGKVPPGRRRLRRSLSGHGRERAPRPAGVGGRLLVLALVAVVLAACGVGRGTGSGGTRPPSAGTGRARAEHPADSSDAVRSQRSGGGSGQSGAQGIRTLQLTLVDPPEGDRPALRVPTTVWLPAGRSGRPAPLVVFAPGYLQCPGQYASLLRSWAMAGLVVAAVSFPATSCGAAPGEEWTVLWQPGELAFVAAVLEQASATGTPGGGALRGRLVPGELAVAGHSDGADAAAAAAFDTATLDPAFRAALVLAGAQLASYGGSWFPPGSPPLLVVQGTADTVNPPAAASQLYQADTAGTRALLWLQGAGHFAPYEGSDPAEQVVAEATTDFLRWALEGDQAAARDLRDLSGVPGVQLQLGGDLAAAGP